MTASYYGISETIIQFVVYEYLRQSVVSNRETDKRNKTDFLTFMLCGASAKLVAAVSTYPYGRWRMVGG